MLILEELAPVNTCELYRKKQTQQAEYDFTL